jgi:putative hydrolase of the HAD superfamily
MGLIPGALRWTRTGELECARDGAPVRTIEALLFDLGGTLDDDGRGWAERFGAILREELPDVDADALPAALDAGERAVLRSEHAGDLGLEEMVALHVRAQLEALAAMTAPRAARIARRFHDETRDRLSSRRALLERLASRMPLAVVSNGCGNGERLVRDAGLGACFRTVVDSSCVGAWKPAPEIFYPALAALGVPPERVAMVGDRIDRDVEGARAAGCLAIWVSGGRDLDPSDPRRSLIDATISSVDELDPVADR